MQFGSKSINNSPVLILSSFHFEKIFFCSLFFLVVISVYKSVTYLLFAGNGTLLAYSVAVNNSINLKKELWIYFQSDLWFVP